MSSAIQTNDERINIRLKHHAKLILERAASFEGQSVSKFVLNSNDSKAFFNALVAPAPFNSKLANALKEHDDRVNSKWPITTI